jgi:hypothetical protein
MVIRKCRRTAKGGAFLDDRLWREFVADGYEAAK